LSEFQAPLAYIAMIYIVMEAIPRHQCLIYDGSPAKMLTAIGAHIKQQLSGNVRCMYLNSPAMVAGLRSYLFPIGVDVQEEIANGRLILSSDQRQLKDGHFDVDAMLRQLEDAINLALSDGYNGLWATGDMTWELGRDRDLKKLVEYEWKLENLFQKYPRLSGLCQYHFGTLTSATVCNGLVSHPAIFVNQTLARLNPHYLPRHAPTGPIETTGELRLFVQNLCALQPEGGWNRL